MLQISKSAYQISLFSLLPFLTNLIFVFSYDVVHNYQIAETCDDDLDQEFAQTMKRMPSKRFSGMQLL